jgi:hypothetical protein
LSEIRISIDPLLLKTLDEASGLMEISREELILKILKLWEKSQTLPLHGSDSLCRIDISSSD